MYSECKTLTFQLSINSLDSKLRLSFDLSFEVLSERCDEQERLFQTSIFIKNALKFFSSKFILSALLSTFVQRSMKV